MLIQHSIWLIRIKVTLWLDSSLLEKLPVKWTPSNALPAKSQSCASLCKTEFAVGRSESLNPCNARVSWPGPNIHSHHMSISNYKWKVRSFAKCTPKMQTSILWAGDCGAPPTAFHQVGWSVQPSAVRNHQIPFELVRFDCLYSAINLGKQIQNDSESFTPASKKSSTGTINKIKKNQISQRRTKQNWLTNYECASFLLIMFRIR